MRAVLYLPSTAPPLAVKAAAGVYTCHGSNYTSFSRPACTTTHETRSSQVNKVALQPPMHCMWLWNVSQEFRGLKQVVRRPYNISTMPLSKERSECGSHFKEHSKCKLGLSTYTEISTYKAKVPALDKLISIKTSS